MGSLGVALLGRPLTPRRPNIAVQSASRSQRAGARDSAGGRVEMGKRRGAESKRREGKIKRQLTCDARSRHDRGTRRSEEHTSELQSLAYLVCRLLLEKKKNKPNQHQ